MFVKLLMGDDAPHKVFPDLVASRTQELKALVYRIVARAAGDVVVVVDVFPER